MADFIEQKIPSNFSEQDLDRKYKKIPKKSQKFYIFESH